MESDIAETAAGPPPSAAPDRSAARRRRVALVAVALLAALPYLNSLSAEFTFDDFGLVLDNPSVPDDAGVLRVLGSESATGGVYRPLTILSYHANRWVSAAPFGFHLLNVLLHVLASVAMLSLARIVLGTGTAALLAAALFATHPIHTEAVASVAGRAEVLSALFVLFSLGAACRASGAGAAHPAAWRIASVLAFGAAILSKENGLTTVPLLVLVETWAGRRRPLGAWLRCLAPYLALALAYLAMRAHLLGAITIRNTVPFLDNPLAHASLAERVASAIVVLWEYLSVLSVPLRLSADESYNQVPVVSSPFDPRLVLALLALGGLGVLLANRRARVVGWAAGFSLIAMSLTANLAFPIGTMKAERLLYLPSVGWCLAAGWLLARAMTARRASAGLAAAVLVVAFAARTWARNGDWRSNFTLFTATAKTSPNSARAHRNAAAIYGRAGQLDEAIGHYHRALAIHPRYASAAAGLAHAYRLKGMEREARYWRAHAAALGADQTLSSPR